MVKKFSYPCSFSNGENHPVTFYVGDAAIGAHPIGFQVEWLSKERGCSVPDDLMESLKKLKDLADEQKVSFEDLCEYVIAELQASSGKNIKSIVDEKKTNSSELANNQIIQSQQNVKK